MNNKPAAKGESALQTIVNSRIQLFREHRVLLDAEEFATLRSQSVISNARRGGKRTAPYAFTEQGVAMRSANLPISQMQRLNPLSHLCQQPLNGPSASSSQKNPQNLKQK
jgi:ORF6N domain